MRPKVYESLLHVVVDRQVGYVRTGSPVHMQKGTRRRHWRVLSGIGEITTTTNTG